MIDTEALISVGLNELDAVQAQVGYEPGGDNTPEVEVAYVRALEQKVIGQRMAVRMIAESVKRDRARRAV